MSNYNNYTLKLDLEFTNLIQPLEDREHKSLERKIAPTHTVSRFTLGMD